MAPLHAQVPLTRPGKDHPGAAGSAARGADGPNTAAMIVSALGRGKTAGLVLHAIIVQNLCMPSLVVKALGSAKKSPPIVGVQATTA